MEVNANVTATSTNTGSSYSPSDSGSWEPISCPHCGAGQLYRVARATAMPHVSWLRCAVCLKGTVANMDAVSPSAQVLRDPRGLPPAEMQIWGEVRACLGVGASAAAVMLCRKLLLHVAVEHGLPAENAKGRSPNFFEAVQHLEQEGIITAKMRPWVDRIKDVGNDANHELTPITAEQAKDVSQFTLQLLVLAYELDALMADPTGQG